MPAVGKSGPCTNFRISGSCAAGLFTSVMVASTISVRLCGGMLVAMPTAMPFDPLTSRFGMRAGRTVWLGCRCRQSWGEIDGVFVEVVEQRRGDAGQFGFGVTVGRRRVAIDRAEISLPIDQRIAQRNGCARRTRASYTARLPCGWYLPMTSPTMRAHLRVLCWAAGPSAAWCTECGDAPASIRRARRAARGR